MRRIQSPCCNDNGAILMFGNDYVEASPGSVLASKPRHRARQESSLCLLGRQGKCCIITKETWKSALHWTFPGDRREEHQGEGEGSFLQKLCHWLNSSGLHTFASWWISQNIPVFKRAEMAEAYKRYRDWHCDIICWGYRQVSAISPGYQPCQITLTPGLPLTLSLESNMTRESQNT